MRPRAADVQRAHCMPLLHFPHSKEATAPGQDCPSFEHAFEMCDKPAAWLLMQVRVRVPCQLEERCDQQGGSRTAGSRQAGNLAIACCPLLASAGSGRLAFCLAFVACTPFNRAGTHDPEQKGRQRGSLSFRQLNTVRTASKRGGPCPSPPHPPTHPPSLHDPSLLPPASPAD